MSVISTSADIAGTIATLHQYIDAGFAIVPLYGVKDGACTCPAGKDCKRSKGKHPNARLAPNGLKNASRDKTVVTSWAHRYPHSNWGVRTGEPLAEGGFAVVIDVDPRNGGDESLAEIVGLRGQLPDTPTQDTGGGGNHYLLKSVEPSASWAPAPGIEILGEGKYFVISPSKHESGGEYVWRLGAELGDVPVAEAPEWVLEGAKGNTRPARVGEETARDTVLGEAFAQANMLGVPLLDGSIAVTCPWADEHSDNRGRGEDSSTVILPPAGGSRFGGFSCLHSHCSQRRWQDVMQKLPPAAVAEARRKYPPRPVEVPVPEENAGGETSGTATSTYDAQMKDCKQKLLYKAVKNGFKLGCDIVNAVTILTYDPRWKDILRYNEFSCEIVFTREPPWYPDDKPKVPIASLTEEALNCLDAWFRRTWGLELGVDKIMQAASIVGRRDSFNPLRNYLDGLAWDGVARLDTWLSTYLGVDQTAYAASVGRKWLISAVARAFKPGCKADHVLILEGPQGRGKSTALATLMPVHAWFADTPIDIGNKDAYLGLRGKWIVELAELSSLRKADLDRAKAFFSSPVDTYRPPYGRIPADFPRQCVFAGTVNLDQYLSDETGNRRFWPVMCGIIDLEALAADRDQLWAEAVAMYRGWVERGSRVGECLWWPSYDEQPIFGQEQDARLMPDTWTDVIRKWLGGRVAQEALQVGGYLPASLILSDALKIEPADQDRTRQTRLGGVMIQQLKWVKVRASDHGKRVYAYRPSNFDTAR